MDFELLDKFLEENGGTSDLLRHIPSNEITHGRITDISRRVPEEGTFLVISHYGTLANAVAGNPMPKSDIMKEAVFAIHKSLLMLKKDLSTHGKNVNMFSPEDLLSLRRSLAVHVYLVYKALSGMESKAVHEVHNKSMQSNYAKNKKGKGGARQSIAMGDSWDSRRAMLIEDMLEVLECPVEQIWDDDVACGFSLPRLLIRTMLSNLNESFLAKGNLKSGPEAYKILGILAKRFRKQEEVMTRLIPLVKVSDDVAKLVARAIEIMVTEYDLPETVPIGMSAAAEMCLDLNQKDANAEKGFASFITELCQLTPAEVAVKSSNSLMDFLEADAVGVRSAVLSSASVLLKWLSSNDGKGPGQRLLRTAFVERILLLHTKDVNALARSKALTVLTKLITSDDLEATECAKCLEEIKPRLMDKAITVRKHAASMIIAILEKFPMIVKTDLNFRDEVDKTRQKIMELLAKRNPKKSHYIYGLVKEFLDQAPHSNANVQEKYGPIEDMGRVRELITELVSEEKFWDACTVLYHVFDKFGSEAGFTGVAEATGRVGLYLSYFNLSADQDSQNKSDLENSFSLSQSMSQEANRDGYVEPEEVIAERKKLLYFQGCETMSEMVPEVMSTITAWLNAGSEQDKAEMINLVGVFVQFGYPVDEKITGSVIKAISQVTKKSAGDLLPAFWSIFIGDRNVGNVPLIKKLFHILSSVTVTVKECLRPIIAEMYKADKMNRETIMILWDAFTIRNEHWTSEDSKYAIFVLGVLGQCDKKIIEQNLNLIIETALGPRGCEDMALVKYTLEAILFTFKKCKKGESDFLTTTRFKSEHILFEKLIEVLEWGMRYAGPEGTDWSYPKVAELSVQIIYRLCLHPPALTENLLKRITEMIFGDGKNPGLSEIKNTERCHIRYLSFMRSLLGGHINYHESVILPEVRRRKALKMKDVNSRNMGKSNRSVAPRGSLSVSSVSTSSRGSRVGDANHSNLSTSSRSSGTSRGGGGGANQSTAEMDVMIGSVGYDGEQEVIRNAIDKLLDSGTFQHFRILTLHFCQNSARHKSLQLKVVCVQALAKIMSVSSESVSKHMDMFLKLWTTAQSSVVKIEIIKQCTVLNLRFPNQMERCGPIIHNGLNSADNIVKMSCMDFITYLALGDMVNVRDHIADVACLLCDGSPKIREMAKDFFNVCAEKGNVISNAVPEVISRLSKKQDLSQKAFQDIMQFLLVRVTKEKQILGLVDKLVARFKGPSARNTRQWQDTAFCLAKLPHQERSLKILKDNMGCYIDKLQDDLVYKSFVDIIETLRKLNKDDLNAKVEDYERELAENREKCLEHKRIESAANRQEGQEENSADESSLMEGDQSANKENGQEEEPMDQGDKENVQGGEKSEDEADQAEKSAAEESDEDEVPRVRKSVVRKPAVRKSSVVRRSARSTVQKLAPVKVKEEVAEEQEESMKEDDQDEEEEEVEKEAERDASTKEKEDELEENASNSEEDQETSEDDDSD